MQVLINNNARFCYQSKEKVLCKYKPKKIEIENLTDDDLEKISSDESGSESDNDESNE